MLNIVKNIHANYREDEPWHKFHPALFSEVRLGSAADSNMAAAAVARIHVVARTSVWQADDFDMC